jgi:hypothetical protein
MIHIATEQPGPLRDWYLLAKLGWHWERAGHRITVGPLNTIRPDVDLAVLHMDRTRIAAERVPRNPAGRPFLNSRVLDISKHLFSTLRVLPGDGWEGAVIVKSNLNCFGGPEWKNRRHGVFERLRRRLAKKHWRLACMLPPQQYPVLTRASEVPDWVWENPEVIVERFVPERDLHLYCLRGWLFFGNHGYTYRLFSRHQVVKAGSMVKYEILGDPPAELQAFRDAHNWDFGKFDYVEVDGRPILLDINKTPTIVTGPDTPRLRHLAAALSSLLGEA